MTLLVVRHAAAGDRRKWDGDDDDRPLTDRGERQAQGLVRQLQDWPITRVLSSPARRCVDTVAPLAVARGLVVELAEGLAEGTADAVLELFDDDDAGAVVACTHGDVVEAALETLRRRGWDLPASPPHAKGSTWALDRDRAVYLVPPE